MARPSKAVAVLQAEGRSHRTKSELEARAAAENAMLSGRPLKELPETKENPVAHAEFRRIKPLLSAIGKNDGLYEAIINRYCMLRAECDEFSRLRGTFLSAAETLRGQLQDGFIQYVEYARLLAKTQESMLAADKQLQQKRKMMLDIERECAMTITAALRSIPKRQAEEGNPLLEALRGAD